MQVLFFGNAVPVQTIRKNNVSPLPQTPKDSLELSFSAQLNPNLTEQRAQRFIEKHSKAIEQLSDAASEAAWASTCQGNAYIEPGQGKTNEQREAEAESAFKDYFNKPQAFAEAQAIMQDRDKITDRLLTRQMEQLLEAFEDAGKSPALLAEEKALTDRTSQLTGVYNAYRAVMNGKKNLKYGNQPAFAGNGRSGTGQSSVDEQCETWPNGRDAGWTDIGSCFG